MKINFNKKMNNTADFLLKRCSYGQIYDRHKKQESYVRRLSQNFYPRFHLYISSENPLILNLHIDQKKASYSGHTAHSGEYEGPLVKKEAERIYQIIISIDQQNIGNQINNSQDKKGFWQKIFNK